MNRRVFLLLFATLLVAQPPAVPPALQPPHDQSLLLRLHAKGTQIYICQSATWKFKAPNAKLYNQTGELAASHYAGPTWEDSSGNKVVGKVIAKVSSPDPHAIPWLLLTAVAHEGKTGFASVTSIQRLDTEGGEAPTTACTENQETAVPYQAVYNFYIKQ